MLESIQRILVDFWGSKDHNGGGNVRSLQRDGRKREYGNLDDIRSNTVNYSGDTRNRDIRTRYKQRLDKRNRARMQEEEKNNNRGIGTRYGEQQRYDKNRIRKQTTDRPGRLSLMWRSLKTVFSNEEQDLTQFQEACGNVNVMIPQNKKPNGTEERRRLRERIARSEAFKRKLLEIKYDENMLEQMRRGRSRFPRLGNRNSEVYRQSQNISEDRITLLQRRVTELEENLLHVTRDLQITQKKLKFAQEKNTLLESLLDDANIDSEYVKSKRDMKNIQRENLKPDSELPPSPRRTVNPLFTSSPMRNPSANTNTQPEDPSLALRDDFYNRYPKIPETESLTQAQKSHSLSPIRIDYSKYSV
ncbi:hypothetical protein HG535_0C06100 [Zygotorulaspora mrakii]|uniref:Uncharacterized protein n=1 Tax=Zygotorulaspora mrakii TaxID=42260 RepID=A0A7H9B0P5_ZYGMR|nr:uncharacterized protein HG535_0C06100 [Zygotorulaspora mrakii]QLG72255.1 hypothetical protein HG535_0C06100 [Zygotorulaspora mrakii]